VSIGDIVAVAFFYRFVLGIALCLHTARAVIRRMFWHRRRSGQIMCRVIRWSDIDAVGCTGIGQGYRHHMQLR